MFETRVGAVEETGVLGVPPARDGAGDLHQLQERRAARPPQAAVRHRAGRQVVPKRDHARQLHLPHARVRADGDGVLRAARRGARSGTATGSTSASPGTCASGSARATCACARTTPTSSRHYSSGTSDIEYLFPIGWSELEGIANRGDFDLTAHTNASGTKLEWVEQDGEPLHPHVIEPAARRQPLDARVPRRRLRRGGRRRPRPHGAAPPSSARAGEGRGPAADRQERRHGRQKARKLYEELRDVRLGRVRRPAARSAAATAARTRSARRIALTIDEQTLEDDTITIRDRDSLAQERISIARARERPARPARRRLAAPLSARNPLI